MSNIDQRVRSREPHIGAITALDPVVIGDWEFTRRRELPCANITLSPLSTSRRSSGLAARRAITSECFSPRSRRDPLASTAGHLSARRAVVFKPRPYRRTQWNPAFASGLAGELKP